MWDKAVGRRRLSCAHVPLPNCRMDATNCTQRLGLLAQQLRLYKPPSSPSSSSDEEDKEDSGQVVSEVGIAESAAATIPKPSKFRPKKAAVFVCLFEDQAGDLRVILTKRSSNLPTHSGEVSFPGGKAEEGDINDADTAMREAEEEIGLDRSLVKVATVMEPFLSKHLLRVVPVIGILSDRKAFKPALNTAEVEAIFDAPLEMFLKDENRRSEEREYLGMKYLIHFFDFEAENEKYLIWGLTAGILIRAASIVFQRPPAFLEQRIPSRAPKAAVEGAKPIG
ncbi:Nudix hydrolase 15, mitochondrial [Asimina triloba]